MLLTCNPGHHVCPQCPFLFEINELWEGLTRTSTSVCAAEMEETFFNRHVLQGNRGKEQRSLLSLIFSRMCLSLVRGPDLHDVLMCLMPLSHPVELSKIVSVREHSRQ